MIRVVLVITAVAGTWFVLGLLGAALVKAVVGPDFVGDGRTKWRYRP